MCDVLCWIEHRTLGSTQLIQKLKCINHGLSTTGEKNTEVSWRFIGVSLHEKIQSTHSDTGNEILPAP